MKVPLVLKCICIGLAISIALSGCSVIGRQVAKEGAEAAARAAAREAGESAVKQAAREAAENAAKQAAREAAENAAKQAAREAAENAAKQAAREAAENAAKQAARSGAQDFGRSGIRNAADDIANALKQKAVRAVVTVTERTSAETDRIAIPRAKSFISIPRSEGEFRSVFGRAPSEADLASLSKVYGDMARLNDAVQLTSSESFRELLEREQSNIIIFVGHNDGGKVIFPDGSIMSFTDLADTASRDKYYVLVSCNSQRYATQGQYGVLRDLTFEEGIRIATRLETHFANQSYSLVGAEVDKALQETTQSIMIQYRAIRVVKTTAVGSVVVVIVIVEANQ